MSIYQHFREEERVFVDQVLSWKEEVKDFYKERLTDFLNPREQEILATIIGTDDELRLSFFGGRFEVERKRALLTPVFIEHCEQDYDCVLFELNYPSKFVTLSHRDILGSLMSVGLKREKFGDILIMDNRIQLIVAKETALYVESNVTSIGKATVSLEALYFSEQMNAVETWRQQSGTVSSLRLDVILAEIYRVSRSKLEPYFTKGYVKVNWKLIESGSFQVEAGDHFSVRGLGRSQLVSIEGKTKKDKVRILYQTKH
ncbi:RNA-binding protein [Alkalihalobacillus pseudalcaliphilus]|uniref:YlmH family RNA-binding protein n=1 Tax=Alkalihalobacillus pseudalcaliphilus TaxID=79884 RepID=UPI00064D8D92|nr:RNA-binding protein [Alkalihalobacillus pseudalcaliphilus]KMK77351.1 RNA-binding protein S4 [Alkalihalobacillus pseudalcaliphilus]